MKNLIVVITLILLLVSCSKDEDDNNAKTNFEKYIQSEIEKQKTPALSILVFNENNILYENCFGKSHIKKNTNLENNHLFLLASVSKTVTATALLQLYDKNLFSLDDNINDYLPFDVFLPNETTPITFKMLLTHTSGIADGSALDDQYYYGEDSPVALDFFLKNYLTPEGEFYNSTENFHDFESGTDYEYTNVGNALIALLVEKISKKDFNTYCKENIFQPLGMTQTFWKLKEAQQANSTIVQPYNYVNEQFEEIQHYTFTDYPNGGLRSTAKDMFKFLSAFAQNGIFNNYQLLSSETVKSMRTLQIPSINNKMGLHLFLLNSENNLWGHDGGEKGVATIMAFNPSTKIGAIILTNQGDVNLDEMLVEAYKFGLDL